jgi:hypothetical protein
VAERPIFRITPPPYVTPEIAEFVRASLTSRESQKPNIGIESSKLRVKS